MSSRRRCAAAPPFAASRGLGGWARERQQHVCAAGACMQAGRQPTSGKMRKLAGEQAAIARRDVLGSQPVEEPSALFGVQRRGQGPHGPEEAKHQLEVLLLRSGAA